MATTPLAGIPYPDATDFVGNGPGAFEAALEAVEKLSVLRFATAVARNAAITAPEAGMVAYLTTPQQLTTYDGTGWVIVAEPVQSWTPAFANTTLGNGTRTGSYHRSDGFCDFQAQFVLGSTSAVTGSVTLPLPILGISLRFGQLAVGFTDTSAGQVYEGRSGTDSSNLLIYSNVVTVPRVGLDTLSSTSPFTWAAGDAIEIAGRYQMASRYS